MRRDLRGAGGTRSLRRITHGWARTGSPIRCSGRGRPTVAVRAHTLQSLKLVTVWPMLSAALLSLITGVLLGLGSKYGLLRYWWVAIKLGLNLLLATLVVTALRGEIDQAADLGRQLALGADAEWNFSNMLYPPIVSPTALIVAFLLSVFKPWVVSGGTAAATTDCTISGGSG
jgi:hypothetical protein